jgi:hypothetical protein
MTTLKTLTIVGALLLGGVSLAVAQGPGTGSYPPVGGGAGGNPVTNPVTSGPPGPSVIPHDVTAGSNLQSAAPTTRASTRTRIAQHPTSTHSRMYMQGNVHHGSKHTGTALSHQKFMNNQNSYR